MKPTSCKDTHTHTRARMCMFIHVIVSEVSQIVLKFDKEDFHEKLSGNCSFKEY